MKRLALIIMVALMACQCTEKKSNLTYHATTRGVGILQLGSRVVDILPEKEGFINKEDFYNFCKNDNGEMRDIPYNRVEIRNAFSEEGEWRYPILAFYMNDELMATASSLLIKYDEDRGEYTPFIDEITIYSPRIIMPNGMRVGMTMKDLQKYGVSFYADFSAVEFYIKSRYGDDDESIQPKYDFELKEEAMNHNSDIIEMKPEDFVYCTIESFTIQIPLKERFR